jgi:hypothetical protein
MSSRHESINDAYQGLEALLDSACTGQCRICGCTEDTPCFNWITRGPCSWIGPDMTLCDSPECIRIDFQRRILG